MTLWTKEDGLREQMYPQAPVFIPPIVPTPLLEASPLEQQPSQPQPGFSRVSDFPRLSDYPLGNPQVLTNWLELAFRELREWSLRLICNPPPGATYARTHEGWQELKATYVRAYNGSRQPIADQTWTRVAIDTARFESSTDLDSPNGRWIAPEAGVYQVDVRVQYEAAFAVGNEIAAAVWINGAPSPQSLTHAAYVPSTRNPAFPIALGGLISVAKGDTVELATWHNFGAVQHVAAAGGELSLAKVG